jgi:hypothetical protein
VQSEAGERFHAERQQRFADVKPWKLFALEDNDAPIGSREQRSCGASGRTAANDPDVVEVSIHLLIMLTSFNAKQRSIELSWPHPLQCLKLQPLTFILSP